MNKVVLIGRLTRDPELRYTGQGTPVASFSIAVNRRKQKDKPQEADFINCVAWGITGENLSKYQSKGSQIAVQGRIQTRNYENKEGKRVYVTEVVAEEIEFLGSKRDNQSNNEFNQDFGVPLDDFHPIEEDDDDLPF
ncbi:single-stranded DNA-binding protein [Alkalibaculum bacchi]|uniref:single-stranded DNA-binding protein n=1 Tax=Alkalibaculum bacchi TaxID=645887 RepID=UPI0026EAF049|nr:single-stranded DNA-binding protein [Alkalibaculum bacchi]